MVRHLEDFREIWLFDFEFTAPEGERPDPICLVAYEYRSGRVLRLWQHELKDRSIPPYPLDSDVLFVAYSSPAELSCHLALDWEFPENVLDLYVEFLCATNGKDPYAGTKLLGALSYYGLDGMAAIEKEAMRKLAIRGGPWSDRERYALLDYCESDVVALAQLLPAMEPGLDLERAVMCRGRYMKAVTRMRWAGVPIDTETLARLRDRWESIQDRLIESVDSRFHVFEGRSFRDDWFEEWLVRAGIPWPKHESGTLMLDDDTFYERARSHPDVSLIREARYSLSQLRLEDLVVGSDGRNRVWLAPFGTITGRNAPSTSQFIFGPSTWLRGLIKPTEGMAIAYIDWSSQEYGVGAALSGDEAMMTAYESGDPYLAFAKQAGRVPENGTKASHARERELFKSCVLGVGYGMGEVSLAQRIDKPVVYARDLLRLHRQTYPKFWQWSEGAEIHAMLWGRLHTVFGWTLHTPAKVNPRSLRNFPCQANGAEMMRLGCSFALERGVSVLAPIHDALLIEGLEWEMEAAIATTQAAMSDASAAVLGGFRLRSNAEVVYWPNRYMVEMIV
jgi:hypothetical protein